MGEVTKEQNFVPEQVPRNPERQIVKGTQKCKMETTKRGNNLTGMYEKWKPRKYSRVFPSRDSPKFAKISTASGADSGKSPGTKKASVPFSMPSVE